MLDCLLHCWFGQVAQCLPEIVPVVSNAMTDIVDAVKVQAKLTMTKCCVAVDNKDVQPVIPKVIQAVSAIEEVPETIHALAAVVFVQTVEGSVLALLVPLLTRGFREKNTSIKRQCAKIVANMSKLVEQVCTHTHTNNFEPLKCFCRVYFYIPAYKAEYAYASADTPFRSSLPITHMGCFLYR